MRTKENIGKISWQFASICIVLILTLGFLGLKFMEVPEKVIGKVANGIGELFKTKVTIKNYIRSQIGELSDRSKLVVLTANLTVTSKKSNIKKTLGIYLGETVVEMMFQDNKIQYIVPVESITEEMFTWNDEKKQLSIHLPEPVIDEEMVEVQSDPDKIEIKTEAGWARLSSYSGKHLENQIRKAIRQEVIDAGKQELLKERAQKNLREKTEEHFRRMIQKFLEENQITTKPELIFS